ncbi:MAG: NAD(P)H-dependent glycerol-3-phosphate dehydrogenase [Clostridium sp.]|nr:NAD(P)H-dependent glycerol-3-phosphate dehydrogenase [Clostridium sp.]
MDKIAFLGAGSFGTALSIMIDEKGYEVCVWGRNSEEIKDINENRVNKKYLPDIKIPSSIEFTDDLDKALCKSKYIVLSVPSYAIRSMLKSINKKISKDQVIVSIAKGIEEETKLRLSEVIREEAPLNPVVVLSGPSHAEEVSRNIPTAVVVSSINMEYALKVQDLFMSKYFRVYTNDDLIGVEIGGAVKNIIALACGICDGIGYGDNTRAAVMTRGMSEIIKIGTIMGGRKETFYGLTGMGDLIVTCTSLHSRNKRAGILIGKGVPVKKALDEIGMVVEGVKACQAFYELSQRRHVSMPITETLYKVIFENEDIEKASHSLMSRDKKNEMH